MFSLASLGLPARGAGAARVGSGSSSPQGKLQTQTPNNERISRSNTYGAVENLKLELSKRLSHCRNLAMLHLHGPKKNQDGTEGQLSWAVLLLFFREVCGFYACNCALKKCSSFHYLKCKTNCVIYQLTLCMRI